MGERPDGTTLERIDNDGDYEPSNCRWATRAEQARNTSQNHFVEYGGRKWCLSDLAVELGIKLRTLRIRMKRGWPPERWAQPPDKRVQVRRHAPPLQR
jgi:hypothetical protein